MAFTAEDRRKLDALYTSWFGEEGRGGYIDRFEELAKSHRKLRRNFFFVMGTLIGSGGLASGLWAIFNA